MRAVSEKYPGYEFIPGWFSWSNTIVLGKQVGATPNGRHAFEPINHGANPHPGFRRDGALTAMSNSICAVQPGYGNTAPVQLELDPGMGRGDEAVQKIADYILTLFEQGATLLNINIVNGQQILEADKDPSKYPDLVVRVTGFTAYFCSLTPEFRKLVVDRILIQGGAKRRGAAVQPADFSLLGLLDKASEGGGQCSCPAAAGLRRTPFEA